MGTLGNPATLELWQWIGISLFIALFAGVLLALWTCRRQLVSREALLPAALALLGLALRLVAHGGPSDIRPVLSPPGLERAGWDVLVNLIQLIWPLQDDGFWMINRVVGAASVPLLYVALRRRFADPLVAVAGAAALAVMPLLVRFAATDAPYILLCAAFLGALIAHDSWAETGSVEALALALGLLTAAMQLRPEGPWLVVPAALLALAAPYRIDVRAVVQRHLPAIVALLVGFILVNTVAFAWALTSHIEGPGMLRYFVLIGSVVGSPWADPQMTPRALALLVLLGAGVAVLRRERAALLWLAATLVALPLATHATGQLGEMYAGYAMPNAMAPGASGTRFSQYANARYHLPSMYLACGLIGLAIATLLRALSRRLPRLERLAVPAAIAIVAVAALPRWELLHIVWTPQREFELLRTGLSRVGPGCRVAAFIEATDAGFVPFEYLAPQQLIDLGAVAATAADTGCLYYYRGGNCFTRDLVPEATWPTFDMNPLCRAFEERYELTPVLEAAVPALPFRGESYARDPLPLGFYRLRARAADGAPR